MAQVGDVECRSVRRASGVHVEGVVRCVVGAECPPGVDSTGLVRVRGQPLAQSWPLHETVRAGAPVEADPGDERMQVRHESGIGGGGASLSSRADGERAIADDCSRSEVRFQVVEASGHWY